MSVFLLELNEINFEHVREYARDGRLPTFRRLIDTHGMSETVSETEYQHLEPWIQWVTAHTGLSFSQHGVFRLGDIVRHDLPQIWEGLEAQGLRVGAISPMNANNACKNAAFFMPDPWTRTRVTGGTLMQKLYNAVAQAVNDNAQSRVTPASLAWLAAGAIAYAKPSNYSQYAAMMLGAARKRPWSKALFLDQLLADVFIREARANKPDFASLFLNAGAHIQHHYMFNSAVYDGSLANPSWYADKNVDPVFEVYELYDNIVSQIERLFPKTRLMLATGLHQDPYPEVTFYWRLRDHAEFLNTAAVPFRSVEPLMSRDFIVVCEDAAQARVAEARLRSICTADGSPLFQIDNRGSDLFVMLCWPHDIEPQTAYRIGDRTYPDLRREVAFVAIKNGEHNGIGYVIDTGSVSAANDRFPLTDMPSRVAAACGAHWPAL